MLTGSSIYTSRPPDETNWIHSWIVKIDEDGHIVPIDTTSNVINDSKYILDEISIYPNPASEYIIINQDNISEVTYNLYDLRGILVKTLKIKSKNHSASWDISDLISGTYCIQILKEGEIIGSKKIVKI